MLSRKTLIPLSLEFDRIRQSGKFFDSPSFGLLVGFGSQSGAKAAFIVSRKIDKRSTVRHKVKRKFADAVMTFLPRLPENVELVFLVKQKAVSVLLEQLKLEINALFERAKLI